MQADLMTTAKARSALHVSVGLARPVAVVRVGELLVQSAEIALREMPGLLASEVVLRLQPDADLPSQGGQHFFDEVLEPLELGVSHITGAREANSGSQAIAVLGVVTPPAERPEIRETLGATVAARDSVIDIEVFGRERPPTVSTQVAVAFVHGFFHDSPLGAWGQVESLQNAYLPVSGPLQHDTAARRSRFNTASRESAESEDHFAHGVGDDPAGRSFLMVCQSGSQIPGR